MSSKVIFSHLILRALTAVSLGACVSNASGQKITLTFPTPGFSKVVPSYTEKNFKFSATGQLEIGPDYRDASPSTDGCLRINDGRLSFEQVGGAPFDIIELSAQILSYTTPPALPTYSGKLLTGRLATGDTVEWYLYVTQDWATYSAPSNFKNLVSVEVQGALPFNRAFGFNIDDVVFGQIPEPVTPATLTLVGAFFLLRRSRR